MSKPNRRLNKRKNKSKRKLSKAVISVIVTAVVLSVAIISLLIVNIFIPIKYLTAYLVKPHRNERGTMRVNYVDVGLGDCALIELPDGKNVLIDGGDGAYSNTLHVFKFLNSRGVGKIDFLICTSVKSEHCGGLAEIVRNKDVGYAYIPYCRNTRITREYNSFISALDDKNVPYSYSCVGEGVESDDGYFLTFLSPTNYLSPDSEYAALDFSPTKGDIENSSAVAWLEYEDTSFAFASDVRKDVLRRIVQDYNASVSANQPYCALGDRSVKLDECKILTAAGHGGEENTYAPWYDLLDPEQVIISVGKGYADYPSGMALSDICSNNRQPLYTMYDGDITVTVKDGGYTIS